MAKRRRRKARKINRRRTVARRTARRANPTVPILFANPRRRRRRAKPRIKRRRRRTSSPRVMVMSNPRRRRRRARGGMSGFRRRSFRRRHSNPTSVRSIGSYARLAVAGALGFMTARFASHLYRTYLEASVTGTDPSVTWRQYLSEALRLAAMGAVTWGVQRAMAKANIGTPGDRLAFMIGGFTETGRTAFAIVAKKVAPGNPNLARFGLDGGMGQGGNPQAFRDAEGRVWMLQNDGQYHLLGELETSDSFMGELETSDSFMGEGDADEEQYYDYEAA